MARNNWVFVSHSNKDYYEVRKVRNTLENWNFRPLLFFLKCLDQDSEISDLIKREIECRTRFLLCESNNTENLNGWVQKEVAYIKSLDRECEVINLNESEANKSKSLDYFRKSSTIYISYTSTGENIAQSLAVRLSKYDFDVALAQNDNSEKLIQNAIKTGLFIPIITEDYGLSNFKEILSARNFDIEEHVLHHNVGTRRPSIISVFTYDCCTSTNKANDETIDELWEEPCVDVYGYSDESKPNIALEFILERSFSWGTIYAFAKNFETDSDVKDDKESHFLYNLILKAEERYNSKSFSYSYEFIGLPGVLGRCYEYGNSLFVIDLEKALYYYEDELHQKLSSCTDRQRDNILKNLAENILRVYYKILNNTDSEAKYPTVYVSKRYPDDMIGIL